MKELVDSKCLKALGKLGLDKAAKAMAKEAQDVGASSAASKLIFLGEDDAADAKYVATLTITVELAQ